MTAWSRRRFMGMASAGAVLTAGTRAWAGAPAHPDLRSLAEGARPISNGEFAARIAKVQDLMMRQKIAGLLVESGSSLEYFTGIRWRRSERVTAAVIPAEGKVVVVTPFFEQPSIQELLRIPAEIRPWNEDENPFVLIAATVCNCKGNEGALAVEDTTRFFIVDQSTRASAAPREVVSGAQLVNACRAIKSHAELALMQAANDVTLAALRHAHARVETGMSGPDIMAMVASATTALGGRHEFALVLPNEASAYPHGTEKPQIVREGSVILIDTGCSVHGYQSDVSRTWVHGEPNARQREVWDTVKRGQEIALETAKIGIPVGDIDHAVRAYYESRGWAKNYGLPGTSHRTGHGIGMDGHEPPNLMRADRTLLEAGMCFSDEPGIYIPGEFGVRMEDCWYMTMQGPKLFTSLARSIDDPI